LARREDLIHKRIAAIVSGGSPRDGEVFIGDDAAILLPPVAPLVMSTDVCVEGVHLDLTLFTVHDLGYKAVMSAASDIAAMGADLTYIVVAVSAPPGADLEALHEGIALAAREAGGLVVGGDVSTGPVIQVAVTVVGSAPAGGALRRNAARVGDYLVVTGPLGAAAAGLRLRRDGASASDPSCRAQAHPQARLRQGAAAVRAGARAGMDLSDGLGIDLHRLADASGVGFEIADVPVASGATDAEAWSGGEDYELLLAVSDLAALRNEFHLAGCDEPLVIGRVAPAGVRELRGRTVDVEGWLHQF
jgi:thiamine-monophosphate kinase